MMSRCSSASRSRDILAGESVGRSLFSYVVRYDSGFAPNPFHGRCTLATCKPKIRGHASVGDWVVGTGSADAKIRRGGHLVHAMKVTEVLSTRCYWHGPRFEAKKPNQYHSWVSASGDNIYEPLGPSQWRQLDSYHSQADGSPSLDHVRRDTLVERVLVSDDYVYFGGQGPRLPERFLSGGNMELVHAHQGYRRVREDEVIESFEEWVRSLGVDGYQGRPWNWLQRK